MIAAVLFGLAIGMAVGAVGGGGAVLGVPVLVYAVGLGVHEATTVSLAVVALGAASGAAAQARRGFVCWRSAGWFALAASAGSVAGTVANRALGGEALLLLFSAVMVAAARATWTRAGAGAALTGGCPDVRVPPLLGAGLGAGVLTGLVGVGGGFVVVPMLAVGLRFGMRQAMATSIVVVAVVSLSGLASHLLAGGRLDVPLTLAMGASAMAGAFVGPHLAARFSTQALGRGFALLVVFIAVGVAVAAVAGARV